MLCFYLLFSERRFDADWGQIITGILSFLVTILIAWQIWTVLDTKSIVKEQKENNDKIVSRFDQQFSTLATTVYFSMFEFYRKGGTQGFELLHFGLLTVKYSIMAGRYDMANETTTVLIESFSTKPIRNIEKVRLLQLIEGIPIDGRLVYFKELHDKIQLMPSNDNV